MLTTIVVGSLTLVFYGAALGSIGFWAGVLLEVTLSKNGAVSSESDEFVDFVVRAICGALGVFLIAVALGIYYLPGLPNQPTVFKLIETVSLVLGCLVGWQINSRLRDQAQRRRIRGYQEE